MNSSRFLPTAQMLTVERAASAALGTARGIWSQSVCSASRRMLAAAALGVLALPAAHAAVSAELWVGYPKREFPDLWAGETGFLGESYGYKLFRSDFMQPTTYASVEGNLSAGTMRAVAQTDYFKSSIVSPFYPPGYFDSMTSAGARVNMADTFTFNNLTFGQVQMGYLDIQVSGSFISPPDASPGRILNGTAFVGAGVGSSDRQVNLNRTQWFAANENSRPATQTDSPVQVGSSVSYVDTLSFQLHPGTTYSFSMSLSVIATGLDADFGSTARAYLRLPEGVSYTSQSGVFLATAVPLSPVPMPPAAWLMLAGLGTLVVRLRKTKQAVELRVETSRMNPIRISFRNTGVRPASLLNLRLLLLPVLLTLAAPGHAAQCLRAGGNALVQTLAGNAFDRKEQDWLCSPADLVVRETSVQVGGTRASMSFTADFGVLRGDLKATVFGTGPLWAQAGGTYESFTNFVGASFADRITLVGAGVVSVVVSASLHSIIGDPNDDTTSEVKLKIDAYRNGLTRIDLAPVTHNVTGNTTTTRTFTVTGTGGDYFDLYADLSGLVTARMPEGVTGEYVAFADASHTGMVTIAAQTGSFTSASGALYTAPIPEPESWALMMLGLVASGLWIRGQSRPAPPRPMEC